MSLAPLLGHEETRRALAHAVAGNRLPGALLFHGPAGIGKQRLALWLAQRLLCERPGADSPCGGCTHCRFTARLEHPDLHWYFPLVRPKVSGGPEKLGDALEEARAAELASRREEPYRPLQPVEMGGLFLAQIARLKRSAEARPAMAGHKVFIVGDAERLVPQESSPEAANALLKLLEEPPANTTIILTAADPEAVLPTIRSRLLPVRVHPLPVDVLTDFLVRERQVAPETAGSVARLAAGSLGAALAFLPGDDEAGSLESLRRQAKEWIEAIAAGSSDPIHQAALRQAPAGARGAFSDTLGHLTLWLRDLAAVQEGAEEVILNVDSLDWLRATAARLPRAARRGAVAIDRVEDAAQWSNFNINPQLALSWLLRSVRREIASPGAG